MPALPGRPFVASLDSDETQSQIDTWCRGMMHASEGVATRGWQNIRMFVGAPITHDSVWNGAAQIVPQALSLATIPLLIRGLGVTAYGVWALVTTLLVIGATLDGGISATAQRYYRLYISQADALLTNKLTTSLLALVVSLTALLCLLGPVIAHLVLSVVHVPDMLYGQAARILAFVGILVGLLLISNIYVGYLRAVGKFRHVAGCVAAANLFFLVAVICGGPSLSLRYVFVLSLVEYGILDTLLIALSWPNSWQPRVGLLPKCQARELWAYSWRAQVTNLSVLVILQTDLLFVAALLPIEQLGYLAVGAQIANAARSLPLFVLAPLLSRLTNEFGTDGYSATTTLAARLNRIWTPYVASYGAIACAAIGFGVRAWFGDYPLAIVAAVILTVGNVFNILSGVASVYCRAIGQPGSEAKYGLALVVGNLALSWPCTWLWGITGAVGSTALVQLLAALYFLGVLRNRFALFSQSFARPHLRRAACLCGLTFCSELASFAGSPGSALAVIIAGAAGAVPLMLTIGFAVRETRGLA